MARKARARRRQPTSRAGGRPGKAVPCQGAGSIRTSIPRPQANTLCSTDPGFLARTEAKETDAEVDSYQEPGESSPSGSAPSPGTLTRCR
jgi:hypothetical protein